MRANVLVSKVVLTLALASSLACGGEKKELLAALTETPDSHRHAMEFLLANMPERDRKSLKTDFLLRQVEFACKARAEVPWSADLPEELFLNAVLPYASVNERRDDWRKDFYDRFIALALKCRTPGEAGIKLNKEVFRQLDVKYHATKRPKPDQSPYESTAAKCASCTGLSILLIDACRAVAIPARLVGTPLWTDRSGNHSWVEVWDGHQWRFLGAAESTKLDDAWFTVKAAKADPRRPEHRIYATSFRRTDTSFPLAWDPSIRYVPAEDVTAFYTARRKVKVAVMKDGKPAVVRLTLRLGGRIVAAAAGDSFSFDLAGGQTYEAELQSADGGKPTTRKVKIAEKGEATIELRL